MKIGLLTTSYPRYAGDYRGVFVKNLVDSLIASGVDVELIEPRGYDVLKRGAGLIPNLKRSFVAKLTFPVYCLHFLLIAVARAPRCDLLHANWSLSGWIAVIAGRLAGRRVLLTERSPLLIETENKWLNRFTGWVMHRSDALVTISEAARRRLKEKFTDLEFAVIPNGVDNDVFKPATDGSDRSELGFDDNAVNIVTVGRVTAVKRLDTLLEALEGVVTAGHDVRAVVLGDGDMLPFFEAQVAASDSLRSRVRFTGRKPQGDVARWMRAADVFVLCSAGESGGNVIFEAMSTGLAVISTPVGWAADYIDDGKNGMITPVGDADVLRDRLERLIADVKLRQRMGGKARATIIEKKLTWNGCAERYQACYRQVLEDAA